MANIPELEGVGVEDVLFADMGWYRAAEGGIPGIEVKIKNTQRKFCVMGNDIRFLVDDIGVDAFMDRILKYRKKELAEQYTCLQQAFAQDNAVCEALVREIQRCQDMLTGVPRASDAEQLNIRDRISSLMREYDRVARGCGEP